MCNSRNGRSWASKLSFWKSCSDELGEFEKKGSHGEAGGGEKGESEKRKLHVK